MGQEVECWGSVLWSWWMILIRSNSATGSYQFQRASHHSYHNPSTHSAALASHIANSLTNSRRHTYHLVQAKCRLFASCARFAAVRIPQSIACLHCVDPLVASFHNGGGLSQFTA